ncbi:hypothetical protein [Actinomadura oligospora]|uniref:hypothetical protein n=1 Tax=Actinomadura oligospora TaxID=111804 RepID=UPI00047EE8A3|nr:hypothetical protein [Actinomadura oligospora]
MAPSPTSPTAQPTFRPGEIQSAPDLRRLLSPALRKALRYGTNKESECQLVQTGPDLDKWLCRLDAPSRKAQPDWTEINLQWCHPTIRRDATAIASGSFAEVKRSRPGGKTWKRAAFGDDAYASTDDTLGPVDASYVLLRVQNVTVLVTTFNGDADENAHDRAVDQQNRARRVASDLTATLNRLRH